MKPRDIASRAVSAARRTSRRQRGPSPENPARWAATPRRTIVWPTRATATSLSAATMLLPVALVGSPDRVRLDVHPASPAGVEIVHAGSTAEDVLTAGVASPASLQTDPASGVAPVLPTSLSTAVVTLAPGGGGGAGIPAPVLAAYRKAEATLASRSPGCHLPWWLLAGIGRIESGHAAGGSVDGAGTTTPGRILGPLLDGSTPNTTVITDTDRGRLDGDLTYDRAVGPMQFLPGTWGLFGRDGNGDGRADPNNVVDAALSAGTYLCSSGRDLRAPDAMAAAVLAYNNSQTYLADVLASGAAYRDGKTPPPPWRPALTPAGDPTSSPLRVASTTSPTTTSPTTSAPTTDTRVTRPAPRAATTTTASRTATARTTTRPVAPTGPTPATTRPAPATTGPTPATTSPVRSTSPTPAATGPARPATGSTPPPSTTATVPAAPGGTSSLPPCPLPTSPAPTSPAPTPPATPGSSVSPTCVPVVPTTAPGTSIPTPLPTGTR